MGHARPQRSPFTEQSAMHGHAAGNQTMLTCSNGQHSTTMPQYCHVRLGPRTMPGISLTTCRWISPFDGRIILIATTSLFAGLCALLSEVAHVRTSGDSVCVERFELRRGYPRRE